ncbi:MAG: DNA-binding domain-containing protein [Betaproteobacteria bacterium]|jgi:hypothetical protein
MTRTARQSGFEDAFVRALLDPDAPGPDGIASQPGFAVYRNTVMRACTEALRANYPAVATLLGETAFAAAVRQFVRETPPATPLLVDYGAGFEAFLAAAPAVDGVNGLPCMARLDRWWTESHIAASVPALAAATVAALAPAALGGTVLHPHPAARWGFFEGCPAWTLWSGARDGARPAPAAALPGEGVLITRPADSVLQAPLTASACAFLDRCAAGAPLEIAVTACLDTDPGADLRAIMAALLRQGAFSDMTRPPDTPAP